MNCTNYCASMPRNNWALRRSNASRSWTDMQSTAGDGQVDAIVCAEFVAYVRDLIAFANECVAMTIPESTMASGALSYAHNWDANLVAYLPESTLVREAARYIPNWDANSVAYLPESTMGIHPLGYVHGWDANPVAYIPESTMGIAAGETLGFQNAGK
jgi:hypothetical protein